MKISVVIIAKNEEENISRAIRLIYEQNYPKEEIEIIVVSDGSIDNTVEIALQKSVKVIILKKSFGISVARNIGVLEATGEIIFFIDAHIFINKNAFRILNECFNQHLNIYGICGKYHTPFKGLDSIRNIRYKALSGKNKVSRVINLDNFTTFSSGIGAFRRSIFDKVGFFKENFRGFAGEDIFFELQILNKDMLLYFEPRINGLHYEKNNNLKVFYHRIHKEVRGFCKVIVSSIDCGLRMPKIDKYYLHFPLLLSISLVMSWIRVEFISIFCLIIILEVFYIKNIWFLKDYGSKEKIFTILHCLLISFLKVLFIPFFIFQPVRLSINRKIKVVIIDEKKKKISKNYKFKDNQSAQSYIPTVIKRIYNVLKLFSKWEIMKIITIIKS